MVKCSSVTARIEESLSLSFEKNTKFNRKVYIETIFDRLQSFNESNTEYSAVGC